MTVEDEDRPSGEANTGGPPARPPLATWKRIVLFVAGWTVLLIGIAGLVLPGIQGILTILVGAAILSLVSETVYRLLRRLFQRWPRAMSQIDRWRQKLHDFLHRD